MPLQDLTPQLRTRLNRMERAVGWFILIATLILLFGLGYYIYKTGENRGWFASKARYFTYSRTAAGLSVGDPVNLLGFRVGKITRIVPMNARGGQPGEDIYIEFEVINDKEEYSGYLWTVGTGAKFADAGFLGKREIELSRGTGGYGTFVTVPVSRMTLEEIKSSPNATLTNLSLGEEIYNGTNLEMKAWTSLATNLDRLTATGHTNFFVMDRSKKSRELKSMWNQYDHHYDSITAKSVYYMHPEEPPALTDRMQVMVAQIQAALPSILDLTNRIGKVLDNAEHLTSNLTVVAADVRAPVSNLNAIMGNLKDPKGSLGEWILPTNINQKLDTTLQTANGTLYNVDSNLVSLNRSLDNLANITSNLNNQVQANTNILTNLSDIVVHTDQFIQGLKRFWLFRHLFAAHKTEDTKSSPAPTRQKQVVRSPKDQEMHP